MAYYISSQDGRYFWHLTPMIKVEDSSDELVIDLSTSSYGHYTGFDIK